MHKRILSVLLVLAMVLSFVPVTVVTAAGTVEASPKAGTHTDAGHSDDCGLTSGWTEWTDATSLPTEGQIVLKTNVAMTKEVAMTGDLTICLNGYVVTAKNGRRLIGTKSDAETTLTICDCTAYEEDGVYHAGALTGGSDESEGGGGAVFVRRGGTFKLYDGRLTGNQHMNDKAGGGAVMLQGKNSGYPTGGKFYMYGGEISENYAWKANGTTKTYGGAISVMTGCYLEINGGTISGNTGAEGGAIYANTGAEVKINNAKLTGNNGTKGGAIYAVDAELTIKDTEITGNTGSNGAIALYDGSDASLDNVTMTGNTATNGSAIYGEGSSKLYIKDTTITGNTGKATVVERSAAIYVVSATVNISGKTVIADNITTAATVPGIVMFSASYDTLYTKDLTDGSQVTFSTPKTVPTDAKEVIALDADKKQTTAWQSGWVRWMDAEGNLKDVGLVNEEFVWGHYHGDQAYTALENADQLMAGGHYYLAGDVQLTKQADLTTNGMTLDLCLNGHDLKAAEGKQIIKLGNKNITCRIHDCTAYTDAEGTYHAGALTGVNVTSTGGAFYVGGSDTMHLYDGKIAGNKAGNAAGVILYGTMYMHGGEISGNTATKNGAGVYIGKNAGEFYMYGGTFSGNTAVKGAAIYAAANAVVEIKDAAITGNTASDSAGGIWVSDGTDITLGGNVQITKNTANGKASNLYLQAALLKLGELDSKAKVGITLEPDRITASDLVFTEDLANDPSARFESDDSAYMVELVDKKLTLTENTVTPPPVQGHTHNGCNDASCTDHAQVEYQAWTDATKLPTEGNWYLDTDVTVSETINYGKDANKTLNLCLNGHTITQKAGTDARMFRSDADANTTITIADCTAKTENGVYTAGKITGFVMESTDSGSEGAVMYLRAGTTLNIFDGIFSNNKTEKKSAGALMINGVFNMYDGEFSNNSAGDGSSNGGAIYLNKDSLATITGGTFKNNTGKNGGAIYVGRDVAHLVENVTFIGNSAKEVGGALALGTDTGTGIVLKNCTFENNTASLKGSAIRVPGVARIEGCTITGNKGGNGAVYVTSGADLTIAGSTTITGNEGNLYLEAQEVINLENLTGTVGVTAANPGRAFTTDCADFSAKVTSDNADYQVSYKEGKLWLETAFEHKHCVCGDTACTEHEMISFQPWDETDSLPEQGSYCLLNDVTLTAAHAPDGDLTLCLHGHTVTISAKNRLFSLPNKDVVLTITDCTAKTEDGVYTAGKLTGGVDSSDGGGAAVFVRAGATLKLYDGIITGNKTMRDGGGGGAIMLQSTKNDMIASFYMYGGEISNNQACSADGTPNRLGGGIYAYRESVLVMEGGVIKNNEAATGAGIYAANATLTIAGEVIGNTASVSGGGVYLTAGATVKVDGKANITGNTAAGKASNLCLDGEQRMAVGTLDAAAKIAVTGQPLSFITESCADYTANFLSDNAKYQIAYKDGAIYLDAAGNHKHCFCAGTSAKCDHTQQTFVEWDDPTALPTSGNYFLSVDVELAGQVTLEASELNLCLNGHTVKVVGEDTRAFYTKGNAILRITDCSEKPGSITGGTRGAILTENNDESAALIELYNGIFTGNTSTTVGGAILIQGASTFNMYGGKITGNALHCKLKVDKNGKPVLNSKGDQTVTSERGGGAVGVHGEGTTFNMYGGQITGNKTTRVSYKKADGTVKETGGYGGGVYVYYGTFNMYGGKIANNTAEGSGGGVFTQYATVNLENAAISGNYAGASGGAAYFSTGTKVTFKNFTVSGNSSKSTGGGLMISGKNTVATMQGSTITGNTSGGSAAGALVQSRAELIMNGCRITGNKSNSSGGGMYISSKSKLTMNGTSITNNVAQNHGGGLYLNKATSTITNSSVSYNTATKSSAGGIKMTGGSLYLNGVNIIGNKAKASGCGIVTSYSTLTENGVKTNYYVTCKMYNCTVADNETEGSGAGMLHQSKETVVEVANCTFTGNKAKSSAGGFYISSNVTITMKDCKVIGNEAKASGGFRLNNCKATVENMEVANNTATSSGGGFMTTGANCNATLTNLDVHGNTASSGAGVLMQSQSNVTFTNSKIYENEATTGNGGGIYISSGGTVVKLQDLEIYKNKAAKNGGGMGTAAGTLVEADNLYIHHNHSGERGGGVNNATKLTLTNSILEMNTTDGCGGALSTTSSGSRYTQWRAGAYVSDCQFIDNTAGSQGGAVYIHRGGPVDLTNVEISGNESGLEGGAIYADGKMKLKNVTITENTSVAGKYAVYLTPADSDGHSYYSGYKTLLGTIVIKDNEGGGVYMAEGIPVVIEGTLGADSYIPVTLSDGVLTQRVLGVYHYEGEDLTYTITAGDRSITDPMAPEGAQEAQEDAQSGNVLLYVGVGLFALIAVAAILMLIKKKKAKAKQN